MRQECFGLGTPAPGWGGLLALARVSPLLGLTGVALEAYEDRTHPVNSWEGELRVGKIMIISRHRAGKF